MSAAGKSHTLLAVRQYCYYHDTDEVNEDYN